MTLAEMLRRETPNGLSADLVDVISQVNDLPKYMTAEECNNGSYHEATRIVTKPSGSERIYGQGVAPEAGVTEVVTEPTCLVAGLSQVDCSQAEGFPGGAAAFRRQEEALFVSGLMDNTFMSRFFDGDRSTYSRRINGLNYRSDYNALSSDYVYDNAGGDASATPNKTSIYIIQFGTKMVNMITKRNSTLTPSAPFTRKDFGEKLVVDPNDSTKQLPMYQTWFEASFGLFIYDPRCVKRIVNISTTNIDGADDFSFDENQLIYAYNDMEYGGRGAIICANRTVKAQMQIRANEKGNGWIQATEGEGPFAKPVLRFWGIPVVEVASITNTQARIS